MEKKALLLPIVACHLVSPDLCKDLNHLGYLFHLEAEQTAAIRSATGNPSLLPTSASSSKHRRGIRKQ